MANNTRDMYSQECDTRAAGSAFAGRFGELGLYCHQKLHDENTRASGIMCLVGPFSWYSCIDAAASDRQIVYTEFWPTNPTPEYSDFIDRAVTVMLNSFGGGDGTYGVMETGTGQVCEAREGGSEVCEFHVSAGTEVTLRPFVSKDADSMQTWWAGGCYASNGEASSDLTKHARPCTLTVNEATVLQFSSTTTPAGAPGQGDGFISRPVRENP